MPDSSLRSRWDESLAKMPLATHYVTPNYFTDPYVPGQRFAVLAVQNSGSVAAVLTGMIDEERIVSGMFSRPQLVFGEGIDRNDTALALRTGVSEIAGDSTSRIDLHSWQEIPSLVGEGMQMRRSSSETSVVVLDLSKGSDAIFAGFSQTRRNEIRRALRQRIVEVKELETDEEIAELYEIYSDWNSRKGNDSETLEKMLIAASQRKNRRIFIAKVNGKVIAGSFYRYCAGGMVEYAANFSMQEFQKFRPNDLIGWHAIQWACNTGCSYFSMGGSHLFLRRFGGKVWETFRYTQDNRPLTFHSFKKNAHEIGAAAFRRLPANVRQSVRRALAR
jgi:hypothetical protein